jgi:CheY-like chemotaxis protein
MSGSTKARVLVVDDDRLFREILSESLKGEKFGVEVAADGASALAKFGAGGFDVLITDMEMPGMSGAALVTAVKAKAPNTVVVAMAAESVGADVQALFEAGCDGLLSKTTLDVSAVVASMEAGQKRHRAVQLAAAHEAIDMARREVAAGLAPAVDLLLEHLEALTSGDAGGRSPAHLQARIMAVARQIRDVLKSILTAGPSSAQEGPAKTRL